MFGTRHVFRSCCGFANNTPTSLAPGYPFPDSIPVCVPTVLFICGTGISTCYPSTVSFDLALGPDLPEQISFTLETLDIRPEGFCTFISLLIPAFSLPGSPPLLTVWLHPASNAPLPMFTHS